jgi:sarcosine oxidase subunit alpha
LVLTEKQPGRLKLVGVRMERPEDIPADGSVIVDEEIRGHICTARYSAALDQTIGLALVDEALSALGSKLEVFQEGMSDRRFHATVVATPFYDPDGLRLRM